MPTTLQFRRYDTANIANTTGAVGEIFIDTDKDTVVVQDGSTVGGFPLAREGAYTQANNARNQANAAYLQANNAYAEANIKLATAGGTITGDLVITGNLEVLGNSTTLNVETLSVEDNEIILNSNVTGSPSLDAFISINRGTSNTAKLKWDENTDQWKWADDDQVFYAFDSALDAYAQANTARDTANGAYSQANGAYTQANGAYAQANGAYAHANIVYAQANAAYGAANNRVLKAGDTMTGALNVQNTLTANVVLLSNSNLSAPNTSNFDGERIRLYDFNQAGHPNYAIGVEGSHIWHGVDDIGPTLGFKWYGNTTLVGLLRTNSTFEVSNTVSAKVLKATGTGTAVDASSGNILTNKVTGTEFAFLNGSYITTVRANIAQSADYTFRLPSSGGTDGFVLSTDGTGNTVWSNAIYELSNGAYAQANGAYAQANGAYAQANGAYAHANIVYDQANTARDQANTARTTANDAYGAANTAQTTAQNAYGAANTAQTTAQNSYGQANTARDQANTARDTANGAYAQANGAYAHANIVYAQANAAYGQANAAYTQANAAYSTANAKVENINALGAIDISSGATNNVVTYSINVKTANTTTVGVTKLVDAVNSTDSANAATANSVKTAYDTATNAYGQANAAYGQANDAYGQANSARLQANNAYAEANLKLNLTGGTVTGDLTVSGNLFVSGANTLLNVTNLTVNDSIIFLANGQVGDTFDIGFVGHFDRGATNTHAGFIRKASLNEFYLFDNYEVEPTNNIIDINGQNFRLGNVRVNTINANSVLILGSAAATQANLTLAHDQANTARDQANTARDTANGAYAQANGAYAQANGAYAQANGAYAQANGAYAQANTRVLKAGDTMTGNLIMSGATINTATANVTTITTANSLTIETATASNGNIIFSSNGTEDMRITNTGFIGIFTTTPNSNLSITGNVWITTGLNVATVNVTTTNVATLNFQSNAAFTTNSVATVTQDVAVTVDAFASATFRSAVYQAQLTRTSPASDYEAITLSVVHDGSTVYLSQYGQNKTNASANMGTFDASITSGTLSLTFKPNVAVVTVKTLRNAVTV